MNTSAVGLTVILDDTVKVISDIVSIEDICRRLVVTILTIRVVIKRIDRASVCVEEEEAANGILKELFTAPLSAPLYCSPSAQADS